MVQGYYCDQVPFLFRLQSKQERLLSRSNIQDHDSRRLRWLLDRARRPGCWLSLPLMGQGVGADDSDVAGGRVATQLVRGEQILARSDP